MYKILSGIAAVTLAASAFGQTIPRPAKDYPIKLSTGQSISVSQMKGKPVVLEFLLTTCPHCQATAAVLSKLSKEFGPRVKIYGIAMNDDANVPEFIKEHKVAFPVGTGPREPLYDFLEHSIMTPRVNFPQLVFIDSKGVIQSQHEGGQDFLGPDQEKNIRAEIQKLTGGASPAKKATTASAAKKKAS